MASCWGGNTIGLHTDDRISVENLLYGVMLRSANDACIALSQYFGQMVHEKYGYG